MLRLLWKQLLQDLKASWQKSAVLGALLLFGMYFWVPLVFRVFGQSGHDVPKPAVATAQRTGSTASAAVQRAPASASSPSTPLDRANESVPGANDFDWQTARRIAQHDPLLRPAEMAELAGEPFHVDLAQFPPPLLFAEAETKPAMPRGASLPVDAVRVSPLEGLVLNSTVVGPHRRAALINSRLYLEGTRIDIDGQVYQLSKVEPRRVFLTQGTTKLELQIQLPQAWEGLTEASR